MSGKNDEKRRWLLMNLENKGIWISRADIGMDEEKKLLELEMMQNAKAAMYLSSLIILLCLVCDLIYSFVSL